MRAMGLVLTMLLGGWLHAQVTQGQSQSAGGLASFTFKGGLTDTYLFRGQVFNDESTWLGEFGVGIGQFSYNLFYTEPTDFGDSLKLYDAEYNHSISYTRLMGNRALSIGYQAYNYDGVLPDTQEFYTRVTHLNKWRPTYGIAFDFDTYKGYYLDFSLTRRFPVTRKINISFSLRGGLSHDLDEEVDEDGTVTEPGFFGKSGFNHTSAHLDLAWQPLNWFRLETGLHYHYALDDFLYDEVRIERDQTVWRSMLTIRLP